MIETTETPEDIERLLEGARQDLRAFEDGVDRKRLLLRLRTASPAHPVLLARALFLLLMVLCIIAAVSVMAAPLINVDLARKLAVFDAVIPVPEDVPGVPAVLGVLALCMLVAWIMSTFAALALGRDAQMLPWEQKQHQKLVNEVTRLTTQKAVMERIRGTPAGARPRIATPVPVSLRDRTTPSPALRSGGLGSSALGGRPGAGTPAGAGRPTGGLRRGGLGGAPVQADPARPLLGGPPRGGLGAAPAAAPTSALQAARSGGLGARPSAPEPESEPPLAAEPANPLIDDFSDIMGDDNDDAGFSAPAQSGGVLTRARAGLSKRATPAGSAGRIRIGGGNLGKSPSGPLSAPRPGRLGDRAATSRAPSAPPTRAPAGGGGGRLAPPLGFPGTPQPAQQRSASSGPNLFGTPPSSSRTPADAGPGLSYGTPSSSGGGGRSLLGAARSSGARPPNEERPANPSPADFAPRTPSFGAIDEPWLRETVEKSQALAQSFPVHAHLEFSQEPNLPFTLVIARATPAMAVRAMISYVEFLASIYTPPRARIELVNVAHLDRSFHRNVEAALEPYFGDNVEVEHNPGRVDITFTDPDPSWGAYPMLPIE